MKLRRTRKILIMSLCLLMILQIMFVPVWASNGSNPRNNMMEIIGLRDQYTRHYQIDDESYIAVSYSEPVNYQKDGSWEEIDNTLHLVDDEKLGNVYQNKANSYIVTFPKTMDEGNPISIEKDNYEISWRIYSDGIPLNTCTGEIVADTVVTEKTTEDDDIFIASKSISKFIYQSIIDGVDLLYTVKPGAVKEDIVINQPTKNVSFTFDVKVTGLIAKKNEDNSISFYSVNQPDEMIFDMQSPFMADSAEDPVFSDKIEMNIIETDSGFCIDLIPCSDWIMSPDRVFPIYIDPTIYSSQVQSNIVDTYVHYGDSAGDHTLADRLVVGTKSGELCRSFIMTQIPSLPFGSSVTDARLNLSITYGTSTMYNLDVYRVNSNWSSYTMTWAIHNSTSKTLIKSNVSSTSYSNYPSSYRYSCDVKNTIIDIYNGTRSNYGFMVKYSNESIADYNRFYSSDYSTSVVRPTLAVTYYNSSVTPLSRGISEYDYMQQGQDYWYSFIPSESANYTFSTSGSLNTYGELYQGSTLLQSDNDDGDSYNFSLTQGLLAGTEYRLKVRGYTTSVSGNYSVKVVGNVSFNSSYTSILKASFNYLLGSGYKTPIHLYTTEECIDIILSYDSHITSLCNTYGFGLPKAFVQALLMRELWCVNATDIAADQLVLNGINDDSSTGYGQIFSETAIGALNFVNSIGMPTGMGNMNPSNSDDLFEMWYDLYSDQSFNIRMVYYEVLNCTDKTSQPNRILWDYSPSQEMEILSRYNGTGDDAAQYGEEVYEYYMIFSMYN